ncbi:hypothetical protein BT96DRAFT_966875 [Gymnopus androsaceus JB14]|uniref:Voltage-dependent ion-selective channel n=1 Tax=Gymnopus androsaceus JB14 TaxID=1447944 RepID=A0A6A4HAX3_9AGAR|nr:hypothetical protein BT96DRAFT_966875 [Gymnopus androsaceus JB14]
MSLPQPVPPSWKAKYTNKKHGAALTNTWTTSNVLRSQIELENQIAKGLKVDILSSLAPEKGTKTAAINAAFKQSGLHTRAALDVFKGPTFTADAVVGRDGFLLGVSPDVEAGAKAVYDSKATTGGVALEVGTKVYLDPAAFVKAKINNVGVIALGYTQALRPGVKLGLGLAVDTQKLNQASPSGPAHKVGASFTFES